MQKSTSLTGAYLAEGTSNVKQVSKNKKPKKSKKPKIIAAAPNLYLKTTPSRKKLWLLTTYNNKKKYASGELVEASAEKVGLILAEYLDAR